MGCGHSGTTELINILNQHPLVHAYLDGPGMEFAVQPNSFDSPWHSWLAVKDRGDERFFRQLAARRKPLAGHWAIKSPSNVCRLGSILKALPTSRVVMMVRDGRDTFISLKERFPAADPAGPFVLGLWVNGNTAGLLFEQDPRLLVMRLEDLTGSPSVHLPRVLAHVGCAHDWAGASAALEANYAGRQGTLARGA